MTTFGLVHGGWHGAWCWELLTPLLEQAGHGVAAMDLPCDDGSASHEAYADVVCDALNGCDDDVVLVGHSLGGHTIPLVASRRPVRHLVYLCSVVPRIGKSLFDQVADDPDMSNPEYFSALTVDEQDRQVWVDLELAREHLFADCDDATAAAAIKRLRPQANHPMTLTHPLSEFPPVSCTYIVCAEDRMVNPEWSKRVARERLGADIIELPGSHSPFLSRPQALAEALIGLTRA
jgi:pimeloyl-ACP methyl ester carboxylesterase